MVANLRQSFKRDAEFAKLDVLVFAGDVLDHLLNWPHEDTTIIEDWMLEILKQCADYNVELWVLEGTPSHDRRQSKRFEIINERFKVGCRLTYADELCVLNYPHFGINVLFVPDEWSPTAEETLGQVHEHMRAAGIDKVDYAIMHGCFDYQLPDFVKTQKHSASAYLSIVKHLIFIGHIHVYSRYERIIAQGSHDRISHGEESPKGYVRATVRGVDDYDIEFVENKGAAIYRTIELEEVALEDAIAACRKIAETMSDNANLRIAASPQEWSLAQLETEMKREFINLNWSSIDRASKKKLSDLKKELANKPVLSDLITIDVQNVTRLVTDRIWNASGANEQVVKAALELLEELK